MTPEEAYEEALRRIEDAAEAKATELRLYDLPLNLLPQEICKIKTLRILFIGSAFEGSKTKITDLPETIAQLTQLHTLDLSDNGLTIIPEIITKVSNLRTLFLTANNISVLPQTIASLTKLQFLDMGGNGLTHLPEAITELTNLQTLFLWGNKLTYLPETIAQLVNLRNLHLGNNCLSSLPAIITQLGNLQTLSINSNKLTALPESIGQLINLEHLHLSANSLTNLPKSIVDLVFLQTLDLTNNPGLPIPLELINNSDIDNPQAIFSYLKAYYQEGSRPLNEVKIILIGEGGVGKTSLVKRLLHNQFDGQENTTKGIQIKRWDVLLTQSFENNPLEEKPILIHLWDFGGQEIMHATHQFFLTQRALYLLVLDARQGERESRVEYWLALIQSFAGESPVLVVINKSDQHHLDINRRGLQQKYPNIVGFVRTSAATGKGIEELKDKIQETIAQLPHLDTPFPQSWWKIKEQLETLQKQQDFLPYEEYRQLCQTTGLHDDIQQRTLIGFLHDLGIALNFDDDRVRDTNILNPEWVTQGVYALITSPQLAQKGGVLARRKIGELLDPVRYPLERQGFILRMMEKFELAYPLDGGSGYLVPDLLPVEELVFTWDNNDALHFVYHYHVLPHSILHRFMVRQHDKICEDIAWRTGVMLAYEGMKALIKADIEDGKIHIAITGKGRRREFLGMLRFTFASIHQNLTGTKPEEHVPIPGYLGVTIPYAFLLKLENENESFTRWPGVAEKINVRTLLGTIETPAMRQQTGLTVQEIFRQLRPKVSDEELRQLCFELDVDYEILEGSNLDGKVREFILRMNRRGRIPDLLSALNQLP